MSELAAVWMPTTPEIDVKLAFARQAGDEASTFSSSPIGCTRSVRRRELHAAGRQSAVRVPAELTTTVERIAAGLFTLESIAYGVNENFMAFCAARGDAETVRIYREYIQPDERAHQQLGQRLLAKYATTPELQQVARETVARVLELAAATRAKAAEKLGTACFPGC